MAERRMFSKRITDSDAFIEMSSAAQALYFHLNQAADDDGFNNQVQVAMMKAHASVDDLKVLMLKNFVIRFESGLIVIKHWRIHNTLRKDRYAPTTFQDELALLNIKPNMSYTLGPVDSVVVADRLPDGCPSIGKVNIGKESIEYIAPEKTAHHSQSFKPPTIGEVRNYCKERKNRIDPDRFVDFYAAKGWMIGKNKIKDWKACIRTWEKREKGNDESGWKTL